MAQTIQIRRGTGSAVPSSLAAGELAINTDTGKFYYGNGSAVSSNFRVDSITAESYTISSSVTSYTFQSLSGSSDFGDNVSDIHKRTGSLNVSGSVTVDGTLTATDVVITDDLTLTDDVNINATGRIYLTGAGGNEYITSPTTGILELAAGLKVLTFDPFHVSNNITASGIIKATSGFEGDLTGNAATATALTAGNKTIDGDLTIGADQAGHNFTVHGASTQYSKMNWDASQDFLKFSDQAKIVFGSGIATGDFDSSIQADGNNLVIYNDTGNIHIGDTVIITGSLEVTTDITSTGLTVNTTGDGQASIISSQAVDLKIASTHGSSNRDVGLELSASDARYSIALDRPNNNLVINASDVDTASTSPLVTISSTGNITASGNIEATNLIGGIVYAGRIFPNGASGPSIDQQNNDVSISTGLKVTTHVTASGDISSSAFIYADRYYSNNQIALHNDGTSIVIGNDNTYPIRIGKQINPISIIGQITASGNISASGTISANSITLPVESYGGEINLGTHRIVGGAYGVIISGSSLGNPTFVLKQSAQTATYGSPVFKFQRTAASSDGTTIGLINFNGIDSSGNDTTYVRITGDAEETGAGTEGGQFEVEVATHDGELQTGLLIEDGDAEDEVDVTIANGSDSLTTVAGNLTANGTATASTGSFDVMTKALHMIPFAYFVSSVHTSELFIPIAGSLSESQFDQYYHMFHAPYNGTVKRIALSWQSGTPGDSTIRVRKASNFDPDDSGDIVETIVISSAAQDTMYYADFSASFSKGDVVAFTVQQSGTDNSYIGGTIAMEFDTSS